MRIRFGMALDGQHSWQRKGGLDEKTVGPNGLLNILEMHLGLVRHWPGQAERVIAYRECLRRADDGMRFYTRSFAVDELGVAGTLLGWRDDLYLYGWEGTFPGEALPQRLADLAAVEHAGTLRDTAPSVGERLAEVARALETRKIPIDMLEVIDRREAVPLRWRAIFERLGAIFSPGLPAPQTPQTCLKRLQAALVRQTGEKVEWLDDGTVTVVTAETPLLAAHWLSEVLGDGADNTLVVAGGNSDLLDEVLAGRGRARQGCGAATPFRPGLQVLPLALRLLWDPVDLEATLAFLTLPMAPMRAAARYRLAGAIAACPGFGNPSWNDALDRIAHDSEDPEDMRRKVRYWVQPERFPATEGAPLAALAERAQRVAEFFRGALASEDEARRGAALDGLAQAQTFRLALEGLIAQGEERIRPAQVDQLLAQATGQGSGNPLSYREVGSVLMATRPDAVAEPADKVIWWWAALPPEPRRTPWYRREREALAAAGIIYPTDKDFVAWQAESWLTPVLAAQKSFVIVMPAAVEDRHPVWLALESMVRPGEGIGSKRSPITVKPAEDMLCGAYRELRPQRVNHRPLPAPRRWWALTDKPLHYNDFRLSFSAVSKLLEDPYQWVLRYKARLEPSRLLQVTDGNKLFGSLAHRLVEKFVAEFRAGATADQVDAWFAREFAQLIEQEGAVLLASGRGAELHSLRRLCHRALSELAALLASTDVVRVESERELEGEFRGGRLFGYADLVLHTRSGAPAIVDMKWSGTPYYRDALAAGMYLQLVLYAEMLRQQSGTMPALAYFILRDARLLAAETGYFPGIRGNRKPGAETTSELWQRFLTTLKWRDEQLRHGLIEVVSAATEPTDDSAPPEDGLDLQAPNPAYNDYTNLCGWTK